MGDLCYCRKLVVVQTAWTDTNAGRRFLTCADRRCHFFRWLDAPLCHRAAVIIPGLIRRINKLEAELKSVEASNRQLVHSANYLNMSKLMLIVTWMLIFGYMFSKTEYEKE